MSTKSEKASYWSEAVPVIRDVTEEMDALISDGSGRSYDYLLGKISEWRNRIVIVCP